jgi:anti-sigma B factor antagonist
MGEGIMARFQTTDLESSPGGVAVNTRDDVLTLPEFSIDVATDGGALILRLCGELDMATSRLLESELGKAAESTARKIVLDLRALRFIDSTGMTLLADAFETSQANGRRLTLRHPPQQVEQLLSLTGLDSILSFED